MVRPAGFGFNPETAESNSFQTLPQISSEVVRRLALEEFDQMVEKMRGYDIDVTVVDESGIESPTTDSVFPNNVFSTHPDGTLCWYPMEAKARRKEKVLLEKVIRSDKVYDLTDNENAGIYLEGTGSLIIDHEKNLVFACRSSRTDEELLRKWSEDMNMKPIVFDALDRNDDPIYHTNVMMCLGKGYAVINLDSIPPGEERDNCVKALEGSGRVIIEIDFENMESFAGNMLEVQNRNGKRCLLMSKTAFESLRPDQLAKLNELSNPVWFDIPIIEGAGGGSVRCMVAELFF